MNNLAWAPRRGLLVGLGSIGRRHLANLRRMLPDADLTLLRHEPTAPHEGEDAADRTIYCLEEALRQRPQFAVIASPAPFHIPTALRLAQHGVHLLIEKPLSHNLDGVDELLALCAEQGVTLLVGYTLRFCRSLQVLREAVSDGAVGRVLSLRAEVGQHLSRWRTADYRGGASARRALGGGALLELSHEFDYVRWLLGEVEGVFACGGKVSDLEIDVEDLVEATLIFTCQAVASIHLDMFATAPFRRCRILGERGVLEWDFLADCVRCFNVATENWIDLHGSSQPGGSPPDRNQMYLAQMRHFFDCIAGGVPTAVPGEEGKRTLECVLAARESIDCRRLVSQRPTRLVEYSKSDG